MRNKKLATMLRSRVFFAIVAAILLSIIVVAVALAYGNTVVIDGDFTDWSDELVVNDTGGVDDCSGCAGQKDLTQLGMASNYVGPGAATTLYFMFHWDDTGISGGGQSVDGCALFDTDADTFINWSLCLTATGNPLGDPPTVTLYECTSDNNVNQCQGSVARTFNGTARLSPTQTDPFGHSGNVCNVDKSGTYDCLTKDAAVEISLPISDITMSGNLVMSNFCTYPSASPTSAPSDCVLPDTQRLTCNVATGQCYQSASSPTAVTLSTFSAESGFSVPVAATFSAALVAVGLGAVWVLSRRRRSQ